MSRKIEMIVGIVALIVILGLGGWYIYEINASRAAGDSASSKEKASSVDSSHEDIETVEPSDVVIKKYYIALDDEGKSGREIGCGDSVVAVDGATINPKDALSVSLKQMLSDHQRILGSSGLYNALYQSDLTLESAKVESGIAKIELSGQIVQGGACDAPRIAAQIEETAKSATDVQEVEVTVNGMLLDNVLSGRG